jgi:hypothetical protein
MAIPVEVTAQEKGVEVNAFGGWFAPTATEGLQGTRAALRRGSLAVGGRLTYWTGRALAVEFTGAFSPAKVRVTATTGSFPRSTEVILGSGKLLFNLTPGSTALGIAIGAGPAIIRAKNTVVDPTQSTTDFGGVGGIAVRLGIGENVALRGDFEDYFYGGDFGRGSKFTQDLVLSGGLSFRF